MPNCLFCMQMQSYTAFPTSWTEKEKEKNQPTVHFRQHMKKAN